MDRQSTKKEAPKSLSCCVCRERDSNPHSRYGQGILSPSCLPFHHRGDLKRVQRYEIILNPQLTNRTFFHARLIFSVSYQQKGSPMAQ